MALLVLVVTVAQHHICSCLAHHVHFVAALLDKDSGYSVACEVTPNVSAQFKVVLTTQLEPTSIHSDCISVVSVKAH